MSTAVTVHDAQQGAVMNAPQRGGLLRPVAPMADIITAKNELDELIAKNLKLNVDFGTVPGTTDRKVLFKAGAERVAGWHGCYFRYEIIASEVKHDVIVPWKKRFKAKYGKNKGEWVETEGESLGLYRYVFKALLIHRASGEIVGEGVGSCSTLESKYIDRPRDLENTIIKMAQKRGAVAAALNAFALSDRFTQDVEDMAHDDDEEVETQPTRPAQPARAEDVDDRGVGVIVYGAKKGTAIDNVDDVSLGMLLAGMDWFDKNETARERFPTLHAQLEPEIKRRISTGAFTQDDGFKSITWVMKNEARRQRFDFFVQALEERRLAEEDAKAPLDPAFQKALAQLDEAEQSIAKP